MSTLRKRRGFSETEEKLSGRHRAGKAWLVGFQIATLIGVITLVVLLLTIINDSFGYVAVRNEIDPASLAVEGVPLEQLPQEALVEVLRQGVSPGLFARFESEGSVAQRPASEIYDLILEYVVSPQVEATWSLSDSLLRKAQIEAIIQEDYPEAELQFRSWLSLDFVQSK